MALGRGLGELLGEIETAYENNNSQDDNQVSAIDLDKIDTNPYQPRKIFDEEKLKELSESIIAHGLLQPIVVTQNQDRYLIVAGERRVRASRLAGLETIHAIVMKIDDDKLRELALIENIQRDDLNIIEVAYSYAGLINDYGITHEELSKVVAKSRSSISNTLRLLTLSSYTQKMLGSSKISTGHAKVIVGLDDENQKIVVDSIIGQKLSVRETEQLVKKIKGKGTQKKLKNSSTSKFDFNELQNVTDKLKSLNFNVKVDKNSLKIEFETQEDIDRLSKYLQNS